MQKFNIKFKFANSDQEIGLDSIESFSITLTNGDQQLWTITDAELNKMLTVKVDKPKKLVKQKKDEYWAARYSSSVVRVIERAFGGAHIETVGKPNSARWVEEASLIKSYKRIEQQ